MNTEPIILEIACPCCGQIPCERDLAVEIIESVVAGEESDKGSDCGE